MHRSVRVAALVVLLAGPGALAFFAGGYFDKPRLYAAIVAWAAVAVVAVADPWPLPRSRAGWLALGGLAALTAWVALSLTWAPLRAAALDDAQRMLLYLGALILATVVMRPRWAARAAEPAVVAWISVAVLYGLSERLLPGLITLDRGAPAANRLEQPLTYSNAMGALAAIGLVLCARLLGDRTRPPAVAAAAAALSVPLAVGEYLTFSRAALVALVAGLVWLVALCPRRRQVEAIALITLAAAPCVLVANALGSVRTLSGPDREQQGLVMLAALLLVMAAAGALAWLRLRATRAPGADAVLRRARPVAVVAAVVISLVPVAYVLASATDEDRIAGANPASTTSASRLASGESNRYEFWSVAVGAVGQEPLRGLGSGAFRSLWLRERTINQTVNDAHSLYLESLVELGLVGLGLLLAIVGGVALAARRAQRIDPAAAAGPIAALAVWALHAGLDWDWEMPALTLVAVAMAGALIARAEQDEPVAGDGPPVSRDLRPEPATAGAVPGPVPGAR